MQQPQSQHALQQTGPVSDNRLADLQVGLQQQQQQQQQLQQQQQRLQGLLNNNSQSLNKGVTQQQQQQQQQSLLNDLTLVKERPKAVQNVLQNLSQTVDASNAGSWRGTNFMDIDDDDDDDVNDDLLNLSVIDKRPPPPAFNITDSNQSILGQPISDNLAQYIRNRTLPPPSIVTSPSMPSPEPSSMLPLSVIPPASAPQLVLQPNLNVLNELDSTQILPLPPDSVQQVIGPVPPVAADMQAEPTPAEQSQCIKCADEEEREEASCPPRRLFPLCNKRSGAAAAAAGHSARTSCATTTTAECAPDK